MFEANRRWHLNAILSPSHAMTVRLRAYALGLVLLLVPMSMTPAAERTITLAPGSGTVFRLEQPFETVLIGDPSVVDVRTQDDRSVILEAQKPGASNIVFVDKRSVAIANIRVVVRDAGI